MTTYGARTGEDLALKKSEEKELIMERFARFIVSHAKAILCVIALVTTVLAIPLITTSLGIEFKSIRMRPPLEGDLPASDQRVADDNRMNAVFPDRDFYVLNMNCPEGVFTFSCLEWMREVSNRAEKIHGRSSPVQSLINYDDVIGAREEDTITIAPLIGEQLPSTDEDLKRVRDRIVGDPKLAGRLVSKDEKAALLWFALKDTLSQRYVHDAVAEIKRSFDDASHRIDIFGLNYMNQIIEDGVNHDAQQLLPWGLLFIVVLVVLSLVWRAVFLLFPVIIFSIIWCLGFMGWIGVPQSVLSGSIPLVLVAVVSSAGFHLIHRIRREYKGSVDEAITRALVVTAWPITLSGTTSVIGFGTLAVFLVLSIREFGLFAAVGIASGLILSLTLIPAGVSVFLPSIATSAQGRVAIAFERLNLLVLRAWVLLVLRHRWVVGVIVGCSLVLSLAGIRRLEVGSNPSHFFPPSNSMRQGLDNITAHFGGDGFASIMFDSGRPDGIHDPEFLKNAERFERRFEEHEGVSYCTSYVDVLPRVNRAFHNDDPGEETIPREYGIAAQLYVLYISHSRLVARHLVDERERRYLMVDCLIEANDSAYIDKLYWQAKSEAQELFGSEKHSSSMGGKLFLWAAQNTYIVRGVLVNAATNPIIDFLFCAVTLWSVSSGLLAIVPVMLAIVLVLGLMGFVGIRLDLANAVIAAIVAGICVDFPIHFLSHFREACSGAAGTIERRIEKAIMKGGLPIHYNALSNLPFLVFLMSDFEPARNFGWLISFTTIVATVSTLIVVPAIIIVWENMSQQGIAYRKDG